MLFVFDENYSERMAEGLNLLEKGNLLSDISVEVTHIITLAGKRGTPDEEVVEIVGKHHGIIFTQDSDFKRLKHMHALYKKHNIGVIYFKNGKKAINYWVIVSTLIKRWEEIKQAIKKADVPFAFEINQHNIQSLKF